MPFTLKKWQELLEEHFAKLAAERAVSGFPLFALEHNLSMEEFGEVARLLRSRLALGSPPEEAHWLVWVVYATEVGYGYDGDEYWLSYENQTPSWGENGSRRKLRDWFHRFARRYHGVRPAGPWAKCFTIIAWPITHAILPVYLQQQLARTLYDGRNRLAGLKDEALTAGEVGRVLAVSSWSASSRLRIFLEQEELAGQIVLALLGHKILSAQDLIYKSTLVRIVSDLERVRNAGEWLKEAQRVFADRLHGSRHLLSGTEGTSTARSSGRALEHLQVGIRPKLQLRRTGQAEFSVIIEVPTFNAIADLSSELRDFLRATRCRVHGTAENWLPAGTLLVSNRTRTLKCWPGAGEALVSFERSNPTIDHLLARECRLTPGPTWLFRVGPEGTAREVVGRLVRPGQEYVVLRAEPVPDRGQICTSCEISCSGVSASYLTLPASLSLDDTVWLRQLGLQVARTVRIWPAGSCARSWDGEGHSEWLTTDSPVFGIICDHTVDRYILDLEGRGQTIIKAAKAGTPVFLMIPPLPRGRHRLSVKVECDKPCAGLPSLAAAEGVLTLEIREPEVWRPGTTSHLMVTLDPVQPSLDSFWEGGVRLSVYGPESRRVSCSISLVNSKGLQVLQEEVASLALPVRPEHWSRKLKAFVDSDKRGWAYLEAVSGCLRIAEDELGECVISLQRDAKPVRWVYRGGNQSCLLRLVDDTDGDHDAVVEFFDFNSPTVPILLDSGSSLAGFDVKAPGGLYVARSGPYWDAFIFSAVGRSLRDLGLRIDLGQISLYSAGKVLELLERWSGARIAGSLGLIRRGQVVDAIRDALFRSLLGRRWVETESAFRSRGKPTFLARELEDAVGSPAFAAILRRQYQMIDPTTEVGEQAFGRIAAQYGVCTEPELCAFSLQLATNAYRLSTAFGADAEGLIERVVTMRVLLRGARFVSVLRSAPDGSAQ